MELRLLLGTGTFFGELSPIITPKRLQYGDNSAMEMPWTRTQRDHRSATPGSRHGEACPSGSGGLCEPRTSVHRHLNDVFTELTPWCRLGCLQWLPAWLHTGMRIETDPCAQWILSEPDLHGISTIPDASGVYTLFVVSEAGGFGGVHTASPSLPGSIPAHISNTGANV